MTKNNITDKQHEENSKKFFKSAQIILSMIAIAEIEYQMYMVDYKFKNPNLNNHMKRVKVAMQEIKRHFANFIKVKDEDEFSYEFTVQLHRLNSFFVGLHTDQLTEYADGLEELLNKTVK